jgi:oxygen-independent coproporphyrinogen-3 oxidase
LRWIKVERCAHPQYLPMNPSVAIADTALPPHAVMCRFESDTPACWSYPAANRFVEAIGAEDVARALRLRGSGSTVGGVAPLAILVNIPFCERPSDQCACKQVVTRRHVGAAKYILALQQELALAVGAMGSRQVVSRIHVGGAVPLFLSSEELAQLSDGLRRAFRVTADAEISIEAAALLCTPGRAASLGAQGFNRLIVRLDERVEGRVLDEELQHVVLATRQIGFAGVTVEIPCATPSQTALGFASAVRSVAALRPARIRIVRHQAMPARLSVARGGSRPDVASAVDRTARLIDAIEHVRSAGYVHVGLDEFALPEDALAIASRQGRLHVGLRGFSARPPGDILALGVSAAGCIGTVSYQNLDGLAEYYAAVSGTRLPVARGFVLDRDDLARQAVIMGLLCQGRVDFEAISLSHLIDMRSWFAKEFGLLNPLIHAGLVDVDHEAMELTAMGRWFAPVVAAVFDRELQRDARRERLSRGDGLL